MAEKKIQKTKVQSDQLSDSDTPDEEVDPQLRTSEEERIYGMIRGSTLATQVALSHTRVQTNPTVERGPPWRPKIKKLSKDRAAEKATQTKKLEGVDEDRLRELQNAIQEKLCQRVDERERNIIKRVQEFEKTFDFVNSHLLKE